MTDWVESFGTKVFGNNEVGKFVNEINPLNLGLHDLFKEADKILQAPKKK
jgi:hypothetical protein